MDDAVREEDGLCAGDPDWVIQQLMTRYRINLGILTGSIIGRGIQPNDRLWTAVARAYNDWTLGKVGPTLSRASKAQSSSPPRIPLSRGGEIRRLGSDPGMVQVLMASAARIPYGNRLYWPIYAAAVAYDLRSRSTSGPRGPGSPTRRPASATRRPISSSTRITR